jgi:dolichol-phosphate mannosyltransferase
MDSYNNKCEVTVVSNSPSISRKKYAWLVVERNEGNRLTKQLEKMRDYKMDLDIIIVDGDSNDGTKEILLAENSGIRDVLISRAKSGFSTDLQIGLIYIAEQGYAGAITSDGNGKDSVSDVGKFIKLLDNGVDFIQGSRFLELGNHSNTPRLRYLGIRFISSPYTSIIARIKITDTTNGFRGYSQKLLLDERLKLSQRFFGGYSLVSYIPFFVARNDLKFSEVSVRRDYPDQGATPTKIVSWSQWLQILLDLLRATFETYKERDKKDWLQFIKA